MQALDGKIIPGTDFIIVSANPTKADTLVSNLGSITDTTNSNTNLLSAGSANWLNAMNLAGSLTNTPNADADKLLQNASFAVAPADSSKAPVKHDSKYFEDEFNKKVHTVMKPVADYLPFLRTIHEKISNIGEWGATKFWQAANGIMGWATNNLGKFVTGVGITIGGVIIAGKSIYDKIDNAINTVDFVKWLKTTIKDPKAGMEAAKNAEWVQKIKGWGENTVDFVSKVVRGTKNMVTDVWEKSAGFRGRIVSAVKNIYSKGSELLSKAKNLFKSSKPAAGAEGAAETETAEATTAEVAEEAVADLATEEALTEGGVAGAAETFGLSLIPAALFGGYLLYKHFRKGSKPATTTTMANPPAEIVARQSEIDSLNTKLQQYQSKLATDKASVGKSVDGKKITAKMVQGEESKIKLLQNDINARQSNLYMGPIDDPRQHYTAEPDHTILKPTILPGYRPVAKPIKIPSPTAIGGKSNNPVNGSSRGGGVNIHINKLIEKFEIHATHLGDSYSKIEEYVTNVLLSATNNASLNAHL